MKKGIEVDFTLKKDEITKYIKEKLVDLYDEIDDEEDYDPDIYPQQALENGFYLYIEPGLIHWHNNTDEISIDDGFGYSFEDAYFEIDEIKKLYDFGMYLKSLFE